MTRQPRGIERQTSFLIMACWLAITAVGGPGTASAGAGEIGFIERFALADDRSVPLDELIPGTDDYFYYHCLYHQHRQEFGEAERLLAQWRQQHGHTNRAKLVALRQHLLTFDQDPKASLDYLQRRLGLHLNHQRRTVDPATRLATTLEANLIAAETIRDRLLARDDDLSEFTDEALPWLAEHAELNGDQRRALLNRLTRPDTPNLVKLIDQDLQHDRRVQFGQHPIHHLLLKDQLDTLLSQRKSLLNETAFVEIYLSKLRPSREVDLKYDLEARADYLQRLWQFVSRLSAAHNGLKAHVLFHQLALDIERGDYSQVRLLTYLRIPRGGQTVSPPRQQRTDRFQADLTKDFPTGLPPVDDDREVIRDYFQHLFVEAASFREYMQYVREDYLKRQFAETKILNGLGDPQRWASLLTPAEYQAIRDRVEITFAATNPRLVASDQPLSLEVDIKNVPNLIVKIYRINARNYYADQKQHLNTNINLDGLVANVEQRFQYDESPFLRVRRKFQFDVLNEPGVYVVDLIGNGQRSRTVLHKGQLRHIVQPTAAGYQFTILDEQDQKLTDAQLWMGGKLYNADERGTITVPYSTDPGVRSVSLIHDQIVTLARFYHDSENYELDAGIHVDRESMREHQMAPVVVRGALSLNGQPITLEAIDDANLIVTAVDHEGTPTRSVVSDVKLQDNQDYVQRIRVPSRTSSLSVQLEVEVTSLTTRKPISLRASQNFTLNQIDKTHATDDVYFSRDKDGYLCEVLGRTGEPVSQRPVHTQLRHRYFRDPIEVTLRSDQNGTIRLGQLDRIASVTARLPDRDSHTWSLRDSFYSYPSRIQTRSGETVRLPYCGTAQRVTRAEFSLLRLRHGTPVADAFKHLSLENGYVTLDSLPAGTYRLSFTRPSASVTIRVEPGPLVAGHLMAPRRTLENNNQPRLQIQDIQVRDNQVVVQLGGYDGATRVHLYATNFVPEYEPFEYLGNVRLPEPRRWKHVPVNSLYVQGQQIGDEFRYVLQRRYTTKFPGNMLRRPELILQPWDIHEAKTDQQELKEDAEMDAAAPSGAEASSENAARADSKAKEAGYANLDFLADGSLVFLNQFPNEQGQVTIDLQGVHGQRLLYVVAVGPRQTVQKSARLNAKGRHHVDLRLADGLDPNKHFSLTKQINVVGTGETVRIADVGSGRFQTYDTIRKVYDLYTTLTPSNHWPTFRFVTDWHNLSEDEKRSRYSEFACHELNFFLAHKDRQFFQNVVRPHLEHKLHKTFVDEYLIGADLSEYRSPWAYQRLNAAEKAMLARRITQEQSATESLLRDRLALHKPDIDYLNRLFNTGLAGRALDESEVKPKLRAGRFDDKARNQFYAAGERFSNFARVPKQADREQGDLFGQRGLQRRGEAAPTLGLAMQERVRRFAADGLFRTLDKTKEWAENNYYRLPISQQDASLIPAGPFWLDWVQHPSDTAFQSHHFVEASRNFSEAMLALAILDLPAEAPEHDTRVVKDRLELKAAGPIILLHQQIEPVDDQSTRTRILVNQNFYQHGQRHRTVNGEKLDRFVTGEFLTNTVYGCHVVVTNPTSSRRTLDVLLQVPVGSLPVGNSKETQSSRIQLDPYRTKTLDYFFYFPAIGEFEHFPVHVTEDDQLVAAADPVELNVVNELSHVDKSSWGYVSQDGTQRDVLDYLENRNLQEIELGQIAWRMNDRSFFSQVTDILRSRHAYDHTLWSYSIMHQGRETIREFLTHEPEIAHACGAWLESPVLDIDPVERRMYQHLEYHPLVNARVHPIGAQRQILNQRFLDQYHRWLNVVSFHPRLDDANRLVAVYYLLLQGRTEEAIEQFEKVDRKRIPTVMQYDYCSAYLNMSRGKTEDARSFAEPYLDYPVDRWREAFAMVIQHIKEIEGEVTPALDPTDRSQMQDQLAAEQGTFDFEIDQGQLQLNYMNLDRVQVRYYLMDVELLFSRNPFVKHHGSQFAYVDPNATQEVALNADQNSTQIAIPEHLRNQNVLIEIEAEGRRLSRPYFSNELSIQLAENYGQLRVVHAQSQKPLSAVYCKVYGRTQDGRTVFFKDGYTDLRGRFDYATVSTNLLDTVDRMSILVLSPSHGASVREVNPPQR